MSITSLGLRLTLIAAAALVYANSFTTSFHLDDGHVLLDHDRMSSAETYLSIHLSRPFGALTFWLNAQVARPGPIQLPYVIVTGGLVPWPFHVVNFAIHLAAGLTLFGLARRTLRLPSVPSRLHESADRLAFVIALFWLVHPLNTMAVTYITQRFESMMGMFFFLTIYAFLRASQSPEPRLWQQIAILAALLGSATKEVMITLPAVLLVYDRVFLAPDWRTVLRQRGVRHVLIAAACWVLPLFVHFVVYGAADNSAAGVGAGALVSRSIYVYTQSMVLPHYVRLSVWPSDLSLEYRDWPGYSKWTSVWPYLLGVGLALAVTAYGALRGRWYGFLGTWFFAILSLTSLVPIVDFVEEYRMYLPLAAVIVGLVLGGERLLSQVRDPNMRRTIAIVLVLSVSTAFGIRTRLRNSDYATDITLWTRNLETRRDDSKAYMHLARAHEELGDYGEAEQLYRIAILKAEKRFLPEADQRLTTLLLLHGDMEGARRELPFAIGASLDTAYYDAILNADGGDMEGAMLRVAEMEQRFPHLSPLKMLEAQLLAEQGKTQESEAAIAEALAIFPGYADYAQLKARAWLKTRFFANPIGRRMTVAFAQQAVLASHGESSSALECLAAAKAAK